MRRPSHGSARHTSGDEILCEAIELAQALGDVRFEAQATVDLAINRMLGDVDALESLALRAQALLASAAALGKRWHVAVFPAEREPYERCHAEV
ncbi:MAG TPA: hypothetical protein VEN29_03635 [Casimicrobiaceae bacterium]|nr:hypothetical protein [Casimicrobiaceae bacterium]